MFSASGSRTIGLAAQRVLTPLVMAVRAAYILELVGDNIRALVRVETAGLTCHSGKIRGGAPPYVPDELMTIIPFLKGHAFDAEMTKVMGMAFDAACKHLDGNGPSKVKEALAKRIIELAGTGERDPQRLCAQALDTFGREQRRG